MDGPSDALVRFRALADQLDDAALAALGNKGLVKRAHNDLTRQSISLGQVSGDLLELSFGSERIALSIKPASSRCTCPATKICRHILAAWISLRSADPSELRAINEAAADGSTRSSGGAEKVDEDPLPVPSQLSEDELRGWAGKELWRSALRELGAGTRVRIEEDTPGLVHLLDLAVDVRFLAGQSWRESLCTCHEPENCTHRVIAVLEVLRQRHGRSFAAPNEELRAGVQTVRSREQLLQATEDALVDLIQAGLTRVSHTAQIRVQNLASSAHGVDLPRLERELQGLAGELQALLGREAHTSSESIALRIARTHGLCTGLVQGVPGLVGQHRRRFIRLASLELIGLGARQLQTRSGYEGLVCYFWDPLAESFASWSEVRPRGVLEIPAGQRFHGPGPWSGCPGPFACACSRFRLTPAWRSQTGRLSGREAMRFQRVGPADWSEVPQFSDWAELRKSYAPAFSGQLRVDSEFAQLTLLRPSSWKRLGLDTVRQAWRAKLEDVEGRELVLVVPGNEAHELAMRYWDDRSDCPELLFGALQLGDTQLEFVPISLLSGGTVISPSLPVHPGPPKRRRRDRMSMPSPAARGPEQPEPPEPPILSEPGPRDEFLQEATFKLLGQLVDFCERGTRSPLSSAADAKGRQWIDAGLSALGPTWTRLREAPDGRLRAQALLRSLHVTDRLRRLACLTAC
jgi:hypothetical protein